MALGDLIGQAVPDDASDWLRRYVELISALMTPLDPTGLSRMAALGTAPGSMAGAAGDFLGRLGAPGLAPTSDFHIMPDGSMMPGATHPGEAAASPPAPLDQYGPPAPPAVPPVAAGGPVAGPAFPPVGPGAGTTPGPGGGAPTGGGPSIPPPGRPPVPGGGSPPSEQAYYRDVPEEALQLGFERRGLRPRQDPFAERLLQRYAPAIGPLAQIMAGEGGADVLGFANQFAQAYTTPGGQGQLDAYRQGFLDALMNPSTPGGIMLRSGGADQALELMGRMALVRGELPQLAAARQRLAEDELIARRRAQLSSGAGPWLAPDDWTSIILRYAGGR